jgi:phage nucleotide-binding protein
MGFKVTKASEAASEPPIIVIYAASGTGKTTCVSRLVSPENPERTLIIDVDKSPRVIADVSPNAMRAEVSTFDDMKELFQAIITNQKPFDKVKNVVIDTFTKLEENLLFDTLKKKHKDTPDLHIYGERQFRMKEFIRNLRLLNRAIILTCHEQELEVEEDSTTNLDSQVLITRKMPAMSGKLANALCGEVDMVLRLAIKERDQDGEAVYERVFQTRKTDRVMAKDRTGELPKLVKADLRKVLGVWYKNKTKQKTKTKKETEDATTGSE